MNALKLSVLVFCLGALGGCATVYEVRSQAMGDQVAVYNGQFETLRSSKKHIVEMGSVSNSMVQFDDLRFNVLFTNRGKNPVEFSSEKVEGTLNGKRLLALSYEAQLQDIENRLSYYGYRVSVYNNPVFVNPSYRSGVGFGAQIGVGGFGFGGFNDGLNDNLDIQRAYADLDRLKRFGLKPKVVQPGETVSGEVTLSGRLPAGDVQYLNIQVNVDNEQHAFEFAYRSKR